MYSGDRQIKTKSYILFSNKFKEFSLVNVLKLFGIFSFKVFERRTLSEIQKELDDRLYSSMMHHYDMAMSYKAKGEQDMYELHMLTCDIRAKQHSELAY